jgi:hypothetical protein
MNTLACCLIAAFALVGAASVAIQARTNAYINGNLASSAAVDFALTFDISEGALLKDLVYEVSDYTNNLSKVKPFRVSVQK